MNIRKMSMDELIGLKDDCQTQLNKRISEFEKALRKEITDRLKTGCTFKLLPVYTRPATKCTITSRRKSTLRYTFKLRDCGILRHEYLLLDGHNANFTKFFTRITSISNKKGEIVYRRSDFYRRHRASLYFKRTASMY